MNTVVHPLPPRSEPLERARRELLDLSTRNRLIAIPLGSRTARLVQVLDERSADAFRLLVTDRKALSFLANQSHPSDRSDPSDPSDPTPPPDLETTALPPADESLDPATGRPRRHLDARLQTGLTPEVLQRRLLDLHRDALTAIEETGVNMLSLALGQLRWTDPAAPETPRHAPLLLIPVRLDRRSASERFLLRAREEDVEENLSLRAKLETDFGVVLPPFPDPENLDVTAYFAALALAVAGQSGWQILPDAMVLGCFSFMKLLMYRDLDPSTWPAERPLLGNPLLPALLTEGFAAPTEPIPDSANLDDLIPVERLDHVVDADGSQTLAIEMVRQNRNLVLQGPPGTGKSQSITNIIATAVLDGKRVLFVAEKLAALEVVKRRLEREGLGELCLELHSHKAGKRAVLDEIGRTWRLGKPKDTDLGEVIPELTARRTTLNTHCATLHGLHTPSSLSAYRVLGELVRLGDRALPAAALDLTGAELWSPTERSSRESLVADVGEHRLRVGLPREHPWRGVRRSNLLPTDLPPLLDRVDRALAQLEGCLQRAHAVAGVFTVEPPTSPAAARHLGLMARHAAQVPTPLPDLAAAAHEVWDTSTADLRDLVAAGLRLRSAQQAVGSQVTDAAWDRDFEPVRSALAAHGRSLLRFLNGDFRRAQAELRGVARGEVPGDHDARIALVDELVAGQRALRSIREGASLGAAAFGTAWRSERSDLVLFQQVADWIARQQADGLSADFRRRCAALSQPAALGPLGQDLDRSLAEFEGTLGSLVTDLDLDLSLAFRPGIEGLHSVPFADLEARLQGWRRDPESLFRWVRYHLRCVEGQALGLTPVLEALHDGRIPGDQALDAFHRAYHTRLLRCLAQSHPELARFDGTTHSRVVEEFRRLDRDRLRLARYRVLARHHAHLPNPVAGLGAVGIVNGELERKRGHRPVRQLLRDAGSVVQSIKPVFMMSPLSVAQFLAPGAVEFDLLVVDEASQVQPVDALGAIARCRQIVVVGDSRQLPPTRFFARMTGEETEPEVSDGAARLQDLESILGLCSARGIPGAMLRWHYRSRHHSLIAISNREFYDDRLFIVPSPRSVDPELGLQFQLVPGATFDSGGTGTNRVEAKAVCRAVLNHARQHPGLSLGVAAFSVRQQQAILDELELLRREHPETEPFFNDHPDEPFFVKNLETVQGDERDVVLISIGYGRDADGFLRMNFGPLGAEGGERRLNVLISRARRRCVVFSSIQAADIDLSRASGRGVASLKAFLQFAESGRLEPGTDASSHPGADPAAFENAVRAALESHGHTVHPRVGIAGFFVDLAIQDPQQPGRYLLGIECDGATYHASRSARDRDRLRQAVLEDHGWRMLRIWCADWFQRPAEQLQKVLQAIEAARKSPAPSSSPSSSPLSPLPTASSPPTSPSAPPAPGVPPQPAAIDREEPPETDDRGSGAPVPVEAYPIARFDPPPGTEPQNLAAAAMAEVLLRIVEIEGPIHEDELVLRVRDLWQLPRAGARLQDAVAGGIRNLLVARRCQRQDDCLDLPDRPVRLRTRADLDSPTLRKPEFLPPTEVRTAILALIQAGHGVPRRQLPAGVARLLGFKTTTAALRARVEEQCVRLEQDKAILESGALLVLGAESTHTNQR